MFVFRTPRFFHHGDGGHNLARGTIAALKAIMFDECSLHGVKISRLTDAFDGGDFIAFVHGGKAETGIHAAAVDVDSASAALSVVAAFLRAGEIEIFA